MYLSTEHFNLTPKRLRRFVHSCHCQLLKLEPINFIMSLIHFTSHYFSYTNLLSFSNQVTGRRFCSLFSFTLFPYVFNNLDHAAFNCLPQVVHLSYIIMSKAFDNVSNTYSLSLCLMVQLPIPFTIILRLTKHCGVDFIKRFFCSLHSSSFCKGVRTRGYFRA